VKAVNLIPTDARRGGGGGASFGSQAPTYLILGVLAVALAFVTVYVLTSNSIADRTAKLTSLQTQLSQTQARAQTLVNYTQFAQTVEHRTQSVRDIASTRFVWYTPLSDLAKVVPANTSLQSLSASLGSTSATGGTGTSTGSSGGGTLLASATGPAIELTGCTKTQDDVARLMSRLRLIDGVTGVTLASSQKPSQASAAVSSGQSGVVGCGSNAPTFDLMVALTPVPGSASATGATGTTAGTAPGTAPTPTTTATGTSTTPSTTTSTTPGATTPGAITTAPGTTTTTPGATSTTPATTSTAGSAQ
jgi:Tfp pilus assembly protein PilN